MTRNTTTGENENDELVNYTEEHGRTHATVGEKVLDSDGDERYGFHYDGETGTATLAAVDMDELPDHRFIYTARGATITFDPDDPGVETTDLDATADHMSDRTLLTTRQMKKFIVCELCEMKNRGVIRCVFGVSQDEAHDIAMQAGSLKRQADRTTRTLGKLVE